MTFEAIKKVGQGLASPRIDFSPKKSESVGNGNNNGKEGPKAGGGEDDERPGKNNAGETEWGYFDVAPETAET
jgi:hypothetical protein